jgi:hypothetical protein
MIEYAISPDTKNHWFYPDELKGDLEHSGLAFPVVAEALACGWEYVRCVVPEFTNWDRYLALSRIVTIGVIAEFRGELVDVVSDGPVLGYDLDSLLDTCPFTGVEPGWLRCVRCGR